MLKRLLGIVGYASRARQSSMPLWFQRHGGNQPLVASFDIFDTLVTRIYATPEDVREHLGELLEEEGMIPSSRSFPSLRFQAEASAWAARGGRNGAAIDDIYRFLAESLGWSEEQRKKALDLEVSLELSAVRPVSDTIRLVQGARRAGKTVCFISDMHLRGLHLQQILARCGVTSEIGDVFVSSDAMATKGTGRLYSYVTRSLNTSPKNMQHTGDDRRADWRGARRHGVKSVLYKRARLNRFEMALLNQLGQSGWRQRSAVAVSKLSRLSRAADDKKAAHWDVLCSAIAPFVSGFAIWLIEQARRRDIKKLFFLARDMQIVHEVASMFVEKQGLDIECIYLYASRNAWQPAAYTGPDDATLAWLTDNLPSMEPRRILGRLVGANRGALDALLQLVGPVVGPIDREGVRAILASEVLGAALLAATAECRRALMSYLREQGYQSTPSCAIVDAGWRGSLQNALARAVRLEGETPDIRGFYIGLRQHNTVEDGCVMTPFLGEDLLSRVGFSLIALIETMLIANHGSTIGYVIDERSTKPLLGPDPSADIEKQWSLVRDCCLTFAHELILSPTWRHLSADLAQSLAVPLLLLCDRPTRQEAALLSQFIFDGGREHVAFRKLARRLSLKDLAKLTLARLRSQSLGEVYLAGPWISGSVALSPAVPRGLARVLLSTWR